MRNLVLRNALWAMLGGLALANARPAFAQTAVQLPTFHYFASSTTVEVPDSGTGFIAGLNSGSGQAE